MSCPTGVDKCHQVEEVPHGTEYSYYMRKVNSVILLENN